MGLIVSELCILKLEYIYIYISLASRSDFAELIADRAKKLHNRF